jgi:hypothetical protein
MLLGWLNQWYSAGLRSGWSGVLVPTGAWNFSLHSHVQTGSRAHPASYAVGTVGSFPGGKAAWAWSWPPTPSSAKVKECVELYLHSSNTPSWCRTEKSTGITLPYLPILLSSGYQELFSWEYSGRGVKLSTHLHLVPRSRCVELYLHSTNTPSWLGA